MPQYKIRDNAKIRVIFKGFIITEITDGTTRASVGALSRAYSLCHQPKVHIYQTAIRTEDTLEIRRDFDLQEDFRLEVTKDNPMIEVFHKDGINPFIRLDERNNNRHDFRWFVNLNEIHREPVEVHYERLRPMFYLNDGLFHTSDRSDCDVRLHHIDAENQPNELFGRFALELTARIYLNDDDRATLTNGIVEPLTFHARDPYKYDIVYDCSCRINEDVGDFAHVYDIITVPYTGRVELRPDPLLSELSATAKTGESLSTSKNLAASPEVYCMGGNTGGG